MPKGYIEAQNGLQLEIVDAAARADVVMAKSRIDKLTAPIGTLEIKENGTFDVLRYARAIVNTVPGGSDTDSGGAPAGTWLGIYTVPETNKTNENGWRIEIPHGLGAVPDWAVVMRTAYLDSTANVAGWVGYKEANFLFANSKALLGKYEVIPMHDEAAQYLYATADKLTCKTPGWGGTLEAGAVLMVAVGLNGGGVDA